MFVSSAKIRNDNLAKSSDDWDDDVPAAADTPREKRSLRKPHSIGELSFDSEAGRQMIDVTEQVYNETKHALYDFKDNTFPAAAKSLAHVERFLMELTGNIVQLQNINKRYEDDLTT